MPCIRVERWSAPVDSPKSALAVDKPSHDRLEIKRSSLVPQVNPAPLCNLRAPQALS